MRAVSHLDVGKFGEKECVKFLKKVKKYKIIGTNLTIGHLEADIVAYDKNYIIFVEVKTRREDKSNIGRPSDAVNNNKRTNLIRFAYSFVKTMPKKYKNKTPRIDVCEITCVLENKLRLCTINYMENAISR